MPLSMRKLAMPSCLPVECHSLSEGASEPASEPLTHTIWLDCFDVSTANEDDTYNPALTKLALTLPSTGMTT